MTADRRPGLFFVIGRSGSPREAIMTLGGEVVTQLPDERRVLALLPQVGYLSLQAHPEIELAGPVSIDAERFERFARLAGLGNDLEGSGAGTAPPADRHSEIAQ
jgi:hypothetical protein